MTKIKRSGGLVVLWSCCYNPKVMIILRFLRRIYVEFAALLLWLLSLLINKTIKLEVYGEEIVDKIHKGGKALIFAFWHNASHPFFYYYRDKKAYIIPVNKIPGEVLATFARKYNFFTEPLNIDGTPAERTETVIRIIRKLKMGHDVSIAVDGPPDEKLYDVKPGIFYLASKSGVPIIPAGMYAKRGLTLWWRWDKYIIPLPFTKVVIVVDKPLHISKKISAEEIQKKRQEVKKKIDVMTEKAKEICLS